MNDFYAVLKQSIIDRGLSTPESREEAYAQARRAMINRLWSYEPPLAEDEIDHRIGQFDLAVGQIEEDVIEAFAAIEAEAIEMQEDDPDDDPHAPSLGGSGATPGYDEVPDDEDMAAYEPAPRALRTIEERSLAVERALSDVEEAGLHDTPAHDADVAGWTVNDEAVEDDDRGDFAAEAPPPTAAPRAPPPKPRAPARTDAATARQPVMAGLAALAARLVPQDRQTSLYALVGVVAVLALILVGGLAFILLAPRPPVVLETEVPGGVSDPDTAIRLPKEAIAVTNTFSLFDGKDPTVFAGDPDNPVRFDGEYARISTSASSPGAKVIIGAGLSSRLAGRTIRVTIEARSARENGAASMRFAYESGVALSHWQTANLSSNFTELGLVWRVPTLRTSPTGDFIDIEPGIPGSGTAVEIKSVRIDMVDG